MKIMGSSSSLIHNNPLISKSPTKLFTSSIKKNDVFSINFPFFHNIHHPFQVGTMRVARSPGLTLENIKWPSPDDEIPFWESSITTSHVTIEAPLSVDKDSDLMHVIHVTAEMAPIAKVGGLGDVVTGLARACLSRGHTVDIMLPFYECLPKQQMTEFNLICTYDSYHDGKWVQTNAYRAVASGIPVILIEPANQFFKGQRIYGGSYDELEAYLFFCRACLEYMQKPRIVLTIHNMEHYGECRFVVSVLVEWNCELIKEQFGKSGLDGDVYATTDKAVDDRTIGHNPERLSLLKGGIVYSNAVVTVSPSYLKETLGSGWLSCILIKYRDKYNGVLNGIDTSLWNPATDPFLSAKFDAQSLAGKTICKEYVQRGLGLPIKFVGSDTHVKGKIPLVVCITRLVAQKGLHLIRHAIKHVEELGGQMVVLGRASNVQVEKEFESLATLHNQGPSIRILLIYSEELSHMLYAAADMVLVPSIYEPCGLAQMIGMRYGAVPIVRRTGGLADTVFDMDDQSKHEVSNGFVFEGIDEKSLSSAMDRAFNFYSNKPDEWQKLVMKIMQIDNSWNNAAEKYISIYNSVRSY
uniref:Starch synthase, chloroplastic/amyloplastic n=1 Tax=Chenopodium quinoa TaxID=63459 RepID=A0A803MES6_CHEQI